MSYTPNTWQKGDVVTSAKLNNIEQGIANAGGVLVVGGTIDGNTMTLDHTWQEIHDAGVAVVWWEDPEGGINNSLLTTIYDENGAYVCRFAYGQQAMTFTTDSADGYPIITDE